MGDDHCRLNRSCHCTSVGTCFKKKTVQHTFVFSRGIGEKICRNAVLSKDQPKLMGLCSGFEEETVKFH